MSSQVRSVIDDCVSGKSQWPLVMFGEAGSGKTCTALVLADWAGSAKYTTQVQLCSDIIAANKGQLRWSGGHAKSAREIWSAWKNANFTVLDELATRKTVTDFQYETIKQAIDLREGQPSIVISNLSIKEIDSVFDDRIASRLRGGTIIELSGDRRVQPTT